MEGLVVEVRQLGAMEGMAEIGKVAIGLMMGQRVGMQEWRNHLMDAPGETEKGHARWYRVQEEEWWKMVRKIVWVRKCHQQTEQGQSRVRPCERSHP